MQNLLKITDLTKKEIREILDLSFKLNKNPKNILAGKNILFAFEKPSLRTKLATEAAINKLGGNVLHVDPNNFLGSREDLRDTVNNVNQWCDAIFLRVFSHNTIENIANIAKIPVINGLCDLHHPMQALADLLTIEEKLGKNKKTTCAFIGDANNVSFSLLEILLKMGHKAAFAGPKEYFFSKSQIDYFENLAQNNKTKVFFTHDPLLAAKDAQVIYADTFVSMGEETLKNKKLKIFQPYQINQELLKNAKNFQGFMHCLPAYRGVEVAAEIIDGPNSWIYNQAKNRMVVSLGVFAKLIKK